MDIESILADFRAKGGWLWAEGGHIRFRAPRGLLTPEIIDVIRDNKPTLLSMLPSMPQHSREDRKDLSFVYHASPLKKSAGHGYCSPISSQELFFFQSGQLNPKRPIPLHKIALVLHDRWEASILLDALRDVVERHEILRTLFIHTEAGIVRSMSIDIGKNIRMVSLSAMRISDLITQTVLEDSDPPDVERREGFRATVIGDDGLARFLVLTLHHICYDGVAMGLILSDIFGGYSLRCRGETLNEAPPPPTYADFAFTQGQWLQSGRADNLKDYWSRIVHDLPPPIKVFPDLVSHQGCYDERYDVSFELPQDTYTKLEGFCRRNGSTVFMALFASFMVIVRHLSKADQDIVASTPLMKRDTFTTKSMVGCLTSHLIVRKRIDLAQSFRQILSDYSSELLGAYSHWPVPTEHVVDASNLGFDEFMRRAYSLIFVSASGRREDVEGKNEGVTGFSNYDDVSIAELGSPKRTESSDLLIARLDYYNACKGEITLFCLESEGVDLSLRRLVKTWEKFLETVIDLTDVPVQELDVLRQRPPAS